jgi:hypothetical protein
MTLRTPLCRAALAVACLAPAGLAAQDSSATAPLTLRGRVIDARTLAAVPGVAVALTSGRDTIADARADSAGWFAAPLRTSVATRLVAHFQRAGYRTDSLALDAPDVLHARLAVAMTPLAPAAVALRPARVTAARTTALSPIEARARRAGGVYIGADEIARRAPERTSDLFRGVQGVALHDENGRTRVTSTRRVELRRDLVRGPRAAPAVGDSTDDPLEGVKLPGSGTTCTLRVGVDGQLMDEDFSVDDVPVSDVAAIEIYRGAATVPIALSSVRGDTKCGAVMIWTRHGGKRAP